MDFCASFQESTPTLGSRMSVLTTKATMVELKWCHISEAQRMSARLKKSRAFFSRGLVGPMARSSVSTYSSPPGMVFISGGKSQRTTYWLPMSTMSVVGRAASAQKPQEVTDAAVPRAATIMPMAMGLGMVAVRKPPAVMLEAKVLARNRALPKLLLPGSTR